MRPCSLFGRTQAAEIDGLVGSGGAGGGQFGGGGAGGEVLQFSGRAVLAGTYVATVGGASQASSFIGPGISFSARRAGAGGHLSQNGHPQSADPSFANGGGTGPYGGSLGGIGAVNNGGAGPGVGSGGGAGAGGPGLPSNTLGDQAGAASGAGGPGIISSISGSPVEYGAGGGGGGNYDPAYPAYIQRGLAGGPSGGNGGYSTAGANAPANRCGGGGGGGTDPSYQLGGTGGSGVIIVRYVTGAVVATGGTITVSGQYTIHTFTANGNFVVT